MERIRLSPRRDYKERINALGFQFNDDYWLENAYYAFSTYEIEEIEKASNQCYQMCVEVVEHIIKNNLFHKMGIPDYIVPALIESWERDDLSLYGRFDFAMVGGIPKMLEFNADTPTTLFEAAIVQWDWKEQLFPDHDQFNNLHEALITSWKEIAAHYKTETIHFTCVSDCLEDFSTTSYLVDTAMQAGINTSLFDISDLRLANENNRFLTPNGDESVDFLFKLYPFEWMFEEEFGKYIPTCQTLFIEPLWKAIMSNKYILVLLSELFPYSKYILKAWSDPNPLYSSYCKKPIFSREGSNVSLVKWNETIEENTGDYGAEGYIYQELVDIQSFDGMHPIIGSWIIGGESVGIGIRESKSRITNNHSLFAPHIIR